MRHDGRFARRSARWVGARTAVDHVESVLVRHNACPGHHARRHAPLLAARVPEKARVGHHGPCRRGCHVCEVGQVAMWSLGVGDESWILLWEEPFLPRTEAPEEVAHSDELVQDIHVHGRDGGMIVEHVFSGLDAMDPQASRDNMRGARPKRAPRPNTRYTGPKWISP